MIAYLSKIIKINNINVVGVIRKDNDETYHVLTIKKRANAISILAKRTFKNIEELQSKIDSKLPVLLVVDGKGVLNKQINFNEEADINWQKNIDYNSIYFTSYKTENSSFISFCRKNVIDEITSTFKSHNLQLVDVYVGSFLSSLLYKSIQENTILSGDLELEFEEDALVSFTKKETSPVPKKYTIGSDVIYNYELPLYGALVHFFITSKNVEKTQNSNLTLEEVIYKKAFNYFGIFMLVAFFTSLLFSYGLIQFYGSENNELNLQNTYSNQSYQKILNLEKQKQEKLNIINQSGTFSNKYLSFYVYEISRSVPNTIALSELHVFPAGKEIKAEKKINFESNTIRVKGSTYNEDDLNQWLKSVKENNWVRNFEIVSLKKDKNNATLFEIKITITNV
ncbi:hypothetical protein EQG63_04785 [Flavobacterium amnicola]|uniref:Uncharacterized protein n=1 Tax=Flavobacterium amnicola TaxID=2506422 RepID=A0A4Q1K618_9FLAO|nr:hypothetical protein [Flavobacterium amnicola]RXR21258.1 hypothetical protein EQG63_04785 [Flavobacterium amnicola]